MKSTKARTRGLCEWRRNTGANTTTMRYTGPNMPIAAAAAPGAPDTRYPMNATVITTGPGVIIATAIASTNCASPKVAVRHGALQAPSHR